MKCKEEPIYSCRTAVENPVLPSSRPSVGQRTGPGSLPDTEHESPLCVFPSRTRSNLVRSIRWLPWLILVVLMPVFPGCGSVKPSPRPIVLPPLPPIQKARVTSVARDTFTPMAAPVTVFQLTWEWNGDDAQFNVYGRKRLDAPRFKIITVTGYTVTITNLEPMIFFTITPTNIHGESP